MNIFTRSTKIIKDFQFSCIGIDEKIKKKFFGLDVLLNVPQKVFQSKKSKNEKFFSGGCRVTYFIYAKSCIDPKWMDTLHAYNLQNETFFTIRNEALKKGTTIFLFQNQVIQQLY